MERTSVNSSNIASVGYDAGTLEIEFNSGSIYQYFDVPETVFDEIMEASSHGQYLNRHVKNAYQYKQIK
ncbi:KTSC domain-containing protein [Candidatus Dojkabacteria bacterium]|nr:KTSC domain-containing protein [Candidatus Dojkabacteria bacterium]